MKCEHCGGCVWRLLFSRETGDLGRAVCRKCGGEASEELLWRLRTAQGGVAAMATDSPLPEPTPEGGA